MRTRLLNMSYNITAGTTTALTMILHVLQVSLFPPITLVLTDLDCLQMTAHPPHFLFFASLLPANLPRVVLLPNYAIVHIALQLSTNVILLRPVDLCASRDHPVLPCQFLRH